MAQQVGRGAAATAAQETETTPGGASGITEADPSQNGTRIGQGAEAGQALRPARALRPGQRHQGQPRRQGRPGR